MSSNPTSLLPLILHEAPPHALDGTTVQLRRLHRRQSVRWLGAGAPVGAVPGIDYHCVPVPPRWPFRRGSVAFQRLWSKLLLPQCAARLRSRLLPARGLVHVTAFEESSALRQLALLEGLGHPAFAVYFPDLLATEPLADLPACRALLAQARLVLVISERLAARVAGATRAPIRLLPPLHDPALHPDSHIPAPPFRLVMTGALYRGDALTSSVLVREIEQGWRRFQSQHPQSLWTYIGPHSERLPAVLRPYLEDLGPLDADSFAAVLRRSHVAFLPTCHAPKSRWEWSVPSRIVDYLAAGLPILHARQSGTASADVLANLPEPARLPFWTADEFAGHLLRLAEDATSLATARSAAAAASARFDPAHLAEETLQQLGWVQSRRSEPALD